MSDGIQLSAQRADNHTPGSQDLPGYGFPRAARLLSASDYSVVFNKNRRLSDKYWTVLVHRSQESGSRLGLAIAKKRARRAVDRNRLKRLARETFRHCAGELTGIELVVMNRDHAINADNATLREALTRLLAKAAA